MGLNKQGYTWAKGLNSVLSKSIISWNNNTGSDRKVINITAKMGSVNGTCVEKNSSGATIASATGYGYSYNVRLRAVANKTCYSNVKTITQVVGTHSWSTSSGSGVTSNSSSGAITTWTFSGDDIPVVSAGNSLSIYLDMPEDRSNVVISCDFTDLTDDTIMPETCTLSYNANGGSGAPSSQTVVKGSQVTVSSTKPTRSNYTFDSWNTNSAGSGTKYASGAKIPLTSNLTLYAKWIQDTVTITAQTDGFTKNSISWKANTGSGNATNWGYSLNNTNYVTYNTNNTSNTTYTKTNVTENAQHTIIVRACRSGSSNYGVSSALTYDLRKPIISNASITVTGPSSGVLTFEVDRNVLWELTENGVSTILSSGSVQSGPRTVDVKLINNKVTTYKLTVKRQDCRDIINSTTLSNISTVPAELILSVAKYYPIAKVVKLDCTSNLDANKWKYTISKTDGTKIVDKASIYSNENYIKNATKTYAELENNVTYKATFYATDKRNIEAVSNEVTFTTRGGIYISNGNGEGAQKELYGVYIYNKSKGDWEVYDPYVYDETWKLSK